MNKLLKCLPRTAKWLLTVLCLLFSAFVFAQNQAPDMADVMRSNGKIYVVVAVCLTILLGLFVYVFLIDRKITRLENNKD